MRIGNAQQWASLIKMLRSQTRSLRKSLFFSPFLPSEPWRSKPCILCRSTSNLSELIALLGSFPRASAPRRADVRAVMHSWMNPALGRQPPARPDLETVHTRPSDKQGAGGGWPLADGWIDGTKGGGGADVTAFCRMTGVKCRWVTVDRRLLAVRGRMLQPLGFYFLHYHGGKSLQV